MSTATKYSEIFKTALNIGDDKLNENIKYNEIEEWDSIGHMTLVAALEEEYKITLETDDIIDFSSFKKGMEILNKYSNLVGYSRLKTLVVVSAGVVGSICGKLCYKFNFYRFPIEVKLLSNFREIGAL